MTNIKMLLGKNIRIYRNNLGISQAQLAEKVGMAANYLGLIENGKKYPSADMVERIAVNLGKDSIDLFALTPVQKKWKEAILNKIEQIIKEELNT